MFFIKDYSYDCRLVVFNTLFKKKGNDKVHNKIHSLITDSRTVKRLQIEHSWQYIGGEGHKVKVHITHSKEKSIKAAQSIIVP